MKNVIIEEVIQEEFGECKQTVDLVRNDNGKIFQTENLKEAELKVNQCKNGVVIEYKDYKTFNIDGVEFFEITL